MDSTLTENDDGDYCLYEEASTIIAEHDKEVRAKALDAAVDPTAMPSNKTFVENLKFLSKPDFVSIVVD